MQRFAVLFVIAACGEPQKPVTPMNPGSGSGSGSAPAPVADTDDAILAVVYLHEIAAASVKPDETICLRVRDTAGQTGDASAEVVAAVREKHARAAPASNCRGGGMDPVRGGEPEGAAVMFDIGPVVRDVRGIHVLGGGGHRGGGHAREVEYKIERTPQGLRVVSERVLLET